MKELRESTNRTIVEQRATLLVLEQQIKEYRRVEGQLRLVYKLLGDGAYDRAQTVLLNVLIKWPSN